MLKGNQAQILIANRVVYYTWLAVNAPEHFVYLISIEGIKLHLRWDEPLILHENKDIVFFPYLAYLALLDRLMISCTCLQEVSKFKEAPIRWGVENMQENVCPQLSGTYKYSSATWHELVGSQVTVVPIARASVGEGEGKRCSRRVDDGHWPFRRLQNF